MDHHSWHARPPPIIQGNNICPTCSISHFPFCPPPRPSFNENPNRFIQSHNNDYYLPERPQFDHRPYNHHAPTDNFHPNDGFGDRLAWPGNPNISSYDHGNVGFKRTRADDSGLFTSGNHVNNYSNLVSEDDRRLKLLIRDHGNISGSSPQVNYENNGSMQDKTILKRNFSMIEGGEHGKIDELPSKLNSNVEMYEFQNPNIDYFEKGASSHPKPGFNLHKYREEKGFGVGQQYMHTNGSGSGNEELGHSQYGQVENSVLNSSRRDGNISQTVGCFTNIDQFQQIQDGVAPYHEGGIQYNSHTADGYLSVPKMGDKKLQSVGSRSVHYPHSQSPNASFQNQNIQRIHPRDSLSMNEPHYSHRTNWHGMQGSMNEQRSNFPMVNQNFDNQMPHSYIVQHPVQPNHDTRQSFRVNVMSEDDVSSPYGRQNLNKSGYPPMFSGANAGPTQASRLFDVHPPLPASPPPPLPVEPPGNPYLKTFASSSPPKASSSLFPISVSSSTDVPSSYASVPEAHSLAQTYYTDKPHRHMSTGFSIEGFEARQTLSTKYSGEVHTFPLRQIAPDKPKIVDASQIFKQPHRATRPDHIVIILRGLPGSGKSYLAKILRDLEVENGGDIPRIHSMDDYFMTEVEKVEDSEFAKSSGSIRGKKAVMKKVMEYCYEPEMEEAYRSSMLKAFKKTLDEGVFSFIIVDDRNLRVADFAQFWAIAKRTGFEVYLLEATYKDPAGCAARNVHGFTQDDIQKMAGEWEEAPSLYLKLDIKSLLHGDDLEESGIQEVDMDMEDGDPAGGLSGSEERIPQNLVVPLVEDSESNGTPKDDKRWDAGGHPTEEVKELRRSKWSDDVDEGDAQRTESSKRNSSALSGLINAYSKEGKSVCWGDKVGNMGFSIGAARKTNVLSLVIGPGAGYNLKSNPLPEQDNQPVAGKTVESKRQNIFQQQLRAERESFKAIFDKRRQRIGGFGTEEE